MSALTTTQPWTDKAWLRKHTTLARHGDPVHLAFAATADGKAILYMDRRRQPRTLEKALRADAADARNHRFGTMAIDPQQPGVARVVVNRPASGMARKLALALKDCGVKRVELLLEDGTSIDSAENEADGLPDVRGCEIPASDTRAMPNAAHDTAHATAQRYRKARAAWLMTREKVDADIRKLQAAVMATDYGDAFGDGLEQDFVRAVDPILDTLDTSLSDILSEAEKAEGEAAERLLASARGTVGAFRAFVAGNATIRHLDQNPFVPVAIARTLQASLDVLSSALR